MGIKVLDFSLGFGKELWSKKKNETKYSIRLIPLGGFVRMLGEENEVEDEMAFNKAPVWKRFLIVLAGPVINIVFGLILFWILASIYNKNAYEGLIVTKRYLELLFKGIVNLFNGRSKKCRFSSDQLEFQQ